MIKEAVVLAGGFGTRLQKVVADVPKPMAPVNGSPFLIYVLEYLLKNGIEHVVLSVGYKHEVISDFFGKNYKNLEISYAVEDKPLGTGGAIKYSLTKINGDAAFIFNGDTFYDVNLRDFYKKHSRAGADLSLSLRNTEDVSRYGAVQIDDNHRITAFVEKGTAKGRGMINGGLYIIPKAVFKKINIFTDNFSIEKDIFERYFKELGFYGFPFDNYFIDIGIPEDYKRANIELKL